MSYVPSGSRNSWTTRDKISDGGSSVDLVYWVPIIVFIVFFMVLVAATSYFTLNDTRPSNVTQNGSTTITNDDGSTTSSVSHF